MTASGVDGRGTRPFSRKRQGSSSSPSKRRLRRATRLMRSIKHRDPPYPCAKTAQSSPAMPALDRSPDREGRPPACCPSAVGFPYRLTRRTTGTERTNGAGGGRASDADLQTSRLLIVAGEFLERRGIGGAGPGRKCRAEQQVQVGLLRAARPGAATCAISFGHAVGPLHDVAQLTHVAGPLGLDSRSRQIRERLDCPFLRSAGSEVLGQDAMSSRLSPRQEVDGEDVRR